MTIQLHITTFKRPEWCFYLLQQIKEQQGEHKINVVVFHDKCNSDYSDSIKFCKSNGWKFLTTNKNLGKWKYWKLLNKSYDYAQNKEYDYFICLPDDIILVDDFFNRCIKMPTSRYPMINFFTVNKHYVDYTLTKKIENIDGIQYFTSGWVDCCFIALPKFMKGLKLGEPQASVRRNNLRGTGCAHELITYYACKFGPKPSLQTVYALCEHIGNIKTVMHEDWRKQHLYKNQIRELDPLKMYLHEDDKEFIEQKIAEFKIKRI